MDVLDVVIEHFKSNRHLQKPKTEARPSKPETACPKCGSRLHFFWVPDIPVLPKKARLSQTGWWASSKRPTCNHPLPLPSSETKQKLQSLLMLLLLFFGVFGCASSSNEVKAISTKFDELFEIVKAQGKQIAVLENDVYQIRVENKTQVPVFPVENNTEDHPAQENSKNKEPLLLPVFYGTAVVGVNGLDPVNMERLENNFKTLKENPSMKVNIIGYSDKDGAVEESMIIAKRRAILAKEWLQERGIDKDRIASVKGERDINGNKNAARRVEFVFTK